MAFKDISVCGETSTSTGNGALTTAGAIGDLRTFADALSDGDTVHVYIRGVSGDADGDWEEVLATFASAGSTLTPSTCYKNSNGNTTLIDWGTGTKQIMAVMPGWSDLDAAGLLLVAEALLPSATLADVIEQILTTRGDIGRVGASGFERYALGAVGLALGSDGTDLLYLNRHPDIILQDQKAAGTSGGTATSGAFRTRDLNTEVYDPNGWCSLAANQVTLAAGSYFIEWTAPALIVAQHQTRLRNATDGATILSSAGGYNVVSTGVQTISLGCGVFTIAAGKALEIQHRVNNTRATDGFGTAANFGELEIYTMVKLWRYA